MSIDSIVNDPVLREKYSLESREEFNRRVRNDHGLGTKPFDTSEDMIDCVWDVTKTCPVGTYARAVNLYRWFQAAIRKNFGSNRNYYFQTAAELFSSRRGKCVDFAFLYTTMSRIAGVGSSFVHIDEDRKGNTAAHACSVIYPVDRDRQIFVDYANGGFDVKHRKFRVFSDSKVRDYYDNYCLAWNKRDIPSFVSVADRLCIAPDSRNNGTSYSYSSPLLRTMGISSLVVLLPFGFLVNGFLGSVSRDVEVIEEEVGEVIVEDKIEISRRKIFPRMVSVLREKYPNDSRFDNLKYPRDYLFVSTMYVNHVRKNLSVVER